MPDKVAAPRDLLTWLWLALGWTALSMAVTTVQGVVRPDYDSWHQAVSALSLGPGGWLQSINLSVFGAVLLGTAAVWRRLLSGGRGATAYPALTAIAGIAFIVAGVIPQDPAPGYDPDGLALSAPTVSGLVHLAVAAVAAGSSVAALLVMGQRFSADPHWLGWPAYSRTMAALMAGCVAIYAVWSTSASGLAGTFERVAMLIPMCWGATFLRRLWIGTPFMVAGGVLTESLVRGQSAKTQRLTKPSSRP